MTLRPRPPRTVLLVDDDAQIRAVTTALLELDGHRVVAAPNALEAAVVAGELRPDLVLVDYELPGISGESLARTLRRLPETAGIPIVFYSSRDETELRTAAHTIGIRGAIAKGDSRVLRRRVAELLDGA